MIHGPYDSWREAFEELTVRRHLLILSYNWEHGKLYVLAVPEKEKV